MIELTKTDIEILGRPNFSCARPAKLLIACEVYKQKEGNNQNAEFEQAVLIHWSLGIQKKYGDDWRPRANEILMKLAEELEHKTRTTA